MADSVKYSKGNQNTKKRDGLNFKSKSAKKKKKKNRFQIPINIGGRLSIKYSKGNQNTQKRNGLNIKRNQTPTYHKN
jgi:hypothetical protein